MSNQAQREGGFLPFVHNFCAEEDLEKNVSICSVLDKYGLYGEVKAENYNTNCLIQAMTLANIPKAIVENFANCCLRRMIPMKHLKHLGQRMKIRFIVSMPGTHNTSTYGARETECEHTIHLVCTNNHYFLLEKETGVQGWAIANFDHPILRDPQTGKLKEEWWKIRRANGSKSSIGSLNSQSLIRKLLDSEHVRELTLSDDGIYGTSIYNKVRNAFTTLEYPDYAAELTHPRRFQESDSQDEDRHLRKKISMLKQSIIEGASSPEAATEVFDRLEVKFRELGFSLEEQLSTLSRHRVPYATVFFDTETTTDQDKHRAYMVSYCTDEDNAEMCTDIGRESPLVFLERLCEAYGTPVPEVKKSQYPPHRVLCIAHNVTYDFAQIFPFLHDVETIDRGTNIITGNGTFYHDGNWVQLSFKDSYKMIPSKLSNFGAMFDIEVEKEYIPYSTYTSDFVEQGIGIRTVDELREMVEDKDLFAKVMENAEKWGLIDGDDVDMMTMSQIYCERDVDVLKRGYQRFCKDAIELMGVDPRFYLTAPALADTYMIEQGVYDNVYKLRGTPRAFTQMANVGGRVMLAYNQKMIVDCPVVDFDAVSLYPSAMEACPGYPTGKPKPIEDSSFDLDSVDYYIVQVRVTEVGANLAFPTTCLHTPAGGNHWTNNLVGETVEVDKFMLEDMVRFNGVKYHLIRGYVWDEGLNTKIHTVIRHLFNKRKELKSQGNPAEMIMKLTMNSAYGKTGQKPIETSSQYMQPSEINAFMWNHHNHIQSIETMPNGQCKVKLYDSISEDFNRQTISVLILSYSKRLMNQVADLIPPEKQLYTDTDSFHLHADCIPQLEIDFKRTYGRDLIGKDMGQFHSDFSFAGSLSIEDGRTVRTSKKAKGEIVSSRFIGLGKKAYADRMVDENGEEAYHVRLKGIPVQCIINKCNESYGGDPIKLYEALHAGEEITFHLGVGGHIMFKTRSNHTVVTDTIDRKVSF